MPMATKRYKLIINYSKHEPCSCRLRGFFVVEI